MSYEKYGISRDAALALVRSSIENDNLFKHCLAAEAVMRSMATALGDDPDKWGLAGLLHDLDAERFPDLGVHTRETVEVLSEKGVNEEIIEAIRLHNLNAYPGERRTTVFHHALAAG